MPRYEALAGINLERLKEARNYYGLSLADVRSKLNDIEEIEDGKKGISYSKLSQLSTLYKKPVLYFFFQDPPLVNPLQVEFRSLEKDCGDAFNKKTREMIEKANEYKLNLQELNKDRETTPSDQILTENFNEINDNFIKDLREKIGISIKEQKKYTSSQDLLNAFREKLYDLGVYVFKDSFQHDDISGLCLYDKEFPIILLNNKTTFTRQLFTLFHELYHIFLKKTNIFIINEYLDEEKECDKFAGSFLMPTEDFLKKIENIDKFTKMKIESIAAEYKISPAAVANRLFNLQRINKSLFDTIQKDSIRPKTQSSGGNYFHTKISYLGKPYMQQVFHHYYDGKITVAAAARFLGVKTIYVSKLATNLFGSGL